MATPYRRSTRSQATRRALEMVNGPSHEEAQEIARDLPDAYLRCRVRSHRFEDAERGLYPDDGFWEWREVCTRCGKQRRTLISFSGYILSTSYKEPEGYLIHGHGRMGVDARAAMRMTLTQRLASAPAPGQSDSPRSKRRSRRA